MSFLCSGNEIFNVDHKVEHTRLYTSAIFNFAKHTDHHTDGAVKLKVSHYLTQTFFFSEDTLISLIHVTGAYVTMLSI